MRAEAVAQAAEELAAAVVAAARPRAFRAPA